MKNLAYISLLALSLLMLPVELQANTEKTDDSLRPKTIVLTGFIEKINDHRQVAKLYVEPNGEAINAVGIIVGFSSTTVLGGTINLENSFCKLVAVKKLDRSAGQAQIFCGLPNPGTSKTSYIGDIAFETDNAGLDDIYIDESSQVLANDGKGTNILNKIDKLNFIY